MCVFIDRTLLFIAILTVASLFGMVSIYLKGKQNILQVKYLQHTAI